MKIKVKIPWLYHLSICFDYSQISNIFHCKRRENYWSSQALDTFQCFITVYKINVLLASFMAINGKVSWKSGFLSNSPFFTDSCSIRQSCNEVIFERLFGKYYYVKLAFLPIFHFFHSTTEVGSLDNSVLPHDLNSNLILAYPGEGGGQVIHT